MLKYNPDTRLSILIGVSFSLFLLLGFRLFQLQILQSEWYQEKSEANSIRVVEEIPGRALICDRHGRVIVENRPSYSISVIPYEAHRNSELLDILAPLLSRSKDDLTRTLSKYGLRSYQPIKVARDVEINTLATIKARGLDLAGVHYQYDPKRFYPFGIAPHTLGYIGEISEAEKKQSPQKKAGDIVGKSGIEKRYQTLLAGSKGYRYLIVNALGQITGELEDKYIPPKSSGNLRLTIDLDLQRLAEELLQDKRGAVVALDPNNGEILAIASSPKYDPEIFSGVLKSSDWQRLQNNVDVPLLHRAIQSGYPSASTFKMITLAAALEEGIITADEIYFCTGSYRLGRTYHCFKRDGHGWITVLDALEQSCDAFFYKLGHQLGVEILTTYMKRFGFGVLTEVDIENEVKGIVPDVSYLDRRYGQGQWSIGLALNIAIGQGESLTTPLQLAQYCGILATSGFKFKPHIFLEMDQNVGNVLQFTPDFSYLDLSAKTYQILRKGMRLVLEGDDGTAKWLESPLWHMAGKTGTAQNPHGEDHALFIGFAPFEKPIIAVAVIIENVGFGSTFAAPVAVRLMTKYLELMQVPHREDLDTIIQNPEENSN